MINVYHCKKCAYEWESITYECACPRCGTDVEIMIELPAGFWHRMHDSINRIEEEPRAGTRARFHLPTPEDSFLFSDTRATLSITDRRQEIENMYRTRDEKIRHVIEESLETVVVDSKDHSYLTARLSPAGNIEIVDPSTGKEIPWHRLDRDEQWALWLCFNDLIDDLDKISR